MDTDFCRTCSSLCGIDGQDNFEQNLRMERESPTLVDRGRTAMFRTELSRPLTLATEDGALRPGDSLFDYGSGRGTDVQRLLQMGVDAEGWDPAHAPTVPKRPSDVVNLGYVVNVIENEVER